MRTGLPACPSNRVPPLGPSTPPVDRRVDQTLPRLLSSVHVQWADFSGSLITVPRVYPRVRASSVAATAIFGRRALAQSQASEERRLIASEFGEVTLNTVASVKEIV